MPSIPQSLLWISLVVLWLFVLVPMLVSKRDAVRRTSDVALATRVLTSGPSARLLKRTGPAAGHRSDPDWRSDSSEDTDEADETDDLDATDDDADRGASRSGSRVFVSAATVGGEADYLDVLDVEVIGDDESVDSRAEDDTDVLPLSEEGFKRARAQAAAEARVRAQVKAAARAKADADARAQAEADARAKAQAQADAEAEAEAEAAEAEAQAEADAAEQVRAEAARTAETKFKAALAQAEAQAQKQAEAEAEAQARVRAAAAAEDGESYEYETFDDSSGLEAEAEPSTPSSRRRPRRETTTAAAVSARKFAFRKRVLMSMAAVLVISALAAFTVAPTAWWVCAATGAATVLYLAYLRRQTRIEQQVRARRARRGERPRAQRQSVPAQAFEVGPTRLREPGAAVLEIDDEDPVFEHLEYAAATARQYGWRGDLPRAAGQ